MSTIKVDQLLAADGTTTTPPTIPALDTRFCTAWVNFNGVGTVSVSDSYNVASITDNGAGNYTANFAVPLANNTYSASANVAPASGSAQNYAAGTEIYTVSSFTVFIESSSGVATDLTLVTAQVFGGQ